MIRFTIVRALLLATVASLATTVAAQESDPEAAAISVDTVAPPTGSNQPANLGLEITGGYDDNVYAIRNREADDFYLLVKPFARAQLGSERSSVTFRAEGEIGRYADLTNEDYEDWLLSADKRARLSSDVSLIGGAEWRWDHEGRASPEAASGLEPTRYRRGFGYLGLVGEHGPVIGRLAGTVTRYEFSDVPGSSGTINNHDRDRVQGEIGARASYALTSGLQLFVQGAYDRRRYDDRLDDFTFARNSHGFSLAPGVRGKLGRQFTAEAFAGWLRQDYRDPRLKDVSTFDVGATLDWQGDGGLDGSFRLDRSVEETTLPDASSYIVTSGRIGLRHDANARLSAGAGLTGTHYDYVGDQRIEFVLGGDLWAKYWLVRSIYLRADYMHAERSSNAAGYDYVKNRFEVSLGAQLHPGFASDPTPLVLQVQAPAGAYLGAMFGHGTLVTALDGPRGANGANTADFGNDGSAAVAVAGYGIMAGSLYLGLEAEASLDGPRWHHSGDRTFSIDKRNAIGVAARLGFATPRRDLIYGRFGWSSARLRTDYAVHDRSLSGNSRRHGLRVGAGLEVPVGSLGFLRTEYVVTSYADYDVPTTNDAFDNLSSDESQFRIGGGFRLGRARPGEEPLPPMQFGGGYVGLQVGHGALITSNQGPRSGGDFILDVQRASHGALAGLNAGFGAVLGHAYLGLEGEGDVSAINWNIERDPNGRTYSAQHKWSYGGSLRGGVLLGNSALLYGRAGLVRTRFDVPYATSGTAVDSKETRPGTRLGGGLEIGLGERTRLRADYTVTTYDAYDIEYGRNVDRFDHTETLFRMGLSWGL